MSLHLIIHRGSHQIGGSCVELACGDSRIILDLGLPLTDPGGRKTRPTARPTAEALLRTGGLPRIPGLYGHEKPAVAAVFISHAHADHHGLAAYVHPGIPVYASQGTKAVLEVNRVFLPWTNPPHVEVMPRGQPVPAGEFSVTGIAVDHSAPDALALLAKAGNRQVLYSGDLRAHGRKGKLFEKLVAHPPPNVDCLLLEGTMVGHRPRECPDEAAVEKALAGILEASTNVVLMFCSSQNVDRVVSAYRAALRTDSLLVIDLYTAWVLKSLAPLSRNLPQAFWRNVRVKYWKAHADRLADAGHRDFLYQVKPRKIEVQEIAEKRDRILFLARANPVFPKALKEIKDLSGIRVVWSMWDGYLTPDSPVRIFAEKHGIAIDRLHAGGHASVADLQRLVAAVKPRMVVPIHTGHPEKYGELFPNTVALRDGERLEL